MIQKVKMPLRLALSDSESIYRLVGAIILLKSAVKIGFP